MTAFYLTVSVAEAAIVAHFSVGNHHGNSTIKTDFRKSSDYHCSVKSQMIQPNRKLFASIVTQSGVGTHLSVGITI